MSQTHTLSRGMSGYICRVCGWHFTYRSHAACPGVTRYTWDNAPDHLKTKTALRKLGLKPATDQTPEGAILRGDHRNYWNLYDMGKAIAIKRKKGTAQ